jgi:nitrile hydratase
VDGIHDLGGMENLGPLPREANEPVFHADWERTVFGHAIALVGAGYFKLDEVRRATEWIPPADYLRMSYYEGWLRSLVALLLEKRFATPGEMARGHSSGDGAPPAPPLPKEMALYAIYNRIPSNVDVPVAPRFRAGDEILTKNAHSLRHTRLPRYARGRRGRIEQDHGIFLLPDTNAHGGPDCPQHVYGVRFSARELWGEDAPARDAVYLDLWEHYLEPRTA